jgi:hypothetical protein
MSDQLSKRFYISILGLTAFCSLAYLFSKSKKTNSSKKKEIDRSQEASLPSLEPALHDLANLSRLPPVNQKMKRNISLLGDYKFLREKEYDENYTIHLKNSEELKIKLRKMIYDGIDELQIVSDFDFTTTSFKFNEKHGDSLFA